ncbi:MAG: hypothetical protein ACT4PZ_21470 [Panacagrimonas sp.]
MNQGHRGNTEFKLAIVGIGFVGQALVRLAHRRGWRVVAAYNRPGSKVGQDLGRVAGLEQDIGVLIEDSETADYSTSGADIALIAAQNTVSRNFRIYEKFLNAGINVLCHASEAYSPRLCDPATAEQIDFLAKQNGVTFTGGGIWDMTRLWSGIILAGPCVEIDSFVHRSSTEIVRQGVQYLPLFGVGLTVEQYGQQFGREVGPLNFYHLPGALVLEKLGYTVTGHSQWREPIVWDEPFYCPELDRHLSAGTCVGTRLRVDVTSREGVAVRTDIEYRLFRPGEIEEMHWRVYGRPEMEITVVRKESGLASASSLINRVPDVMMARPGIVEVTEMGPLLPPVLRGSAST